MMIGQRLRILLSDPSSWIFGLRFTDAIAFTLPSRTHMVNNTSLQKFARLAQKRLTTQLLNELKSGLQCSPFEASAIVDTVHKIYAPYFHTNGTLKPGQMHFQIVSVENSPAVPLAQCRYVTATLTVDDPDEDLTIREASGVIALRHHRMQRVCTEALQQGGVLTVEDLANRLFNCGERTICRDLHTLRKKNIFVPLRSTIKDMGRTLSHRTLVVTQWLQGKEYSEISRNTVHSIPAVQNYVDKFKRVVALMHENFDIHTIAFLVKLSPSLAEEYCKISRNTKTLACRQKELRSFLKKITTTQGGHADAQ
jgi:hypothetical protein